MLYEMYKKKMKFLTEYTHPRLIKSGGGKKRKERFTGLAAVGWLYRLTNTVTRQSSSYSSIITRYAYYVYIDV